MGLTNVQRNYIRHIRRRHGNIYKFTTHDDPTIASLNLQEHLHVAEKWLKKWKIKVNESKSSHVTFTLRKCHCAAVNIKQTIISQTEAVKYLRLHFDFRLNVKEHIARTRKQIDLNQKRSTG